MRIVTATSHRHWQKSALLDHAVAGDMQRAAPLGSVFLASSASSCTTEAVCSVMLAKAALPAGWCHWQCVLAKHFEPRHAASPRGQTPPQ
jgi:hypothetical protein